MHSMNALHMEDWKPCLIAGYEISTQGRLRKISGEILEVKSYETKPGGPTYAKKSNQYIHHLVLEAFVGPRPKGMQCRHINGDSLDNRLENLAWGTASEDNHDRVRNGTHQHARRTECLHGHPLDGVRYRDDGTVLQRYCTTCDRMRHQAQKAQEKEQRTTCPNAHPFDGVRIIHGVESRYCTVCTNAALEKGRSIRTYPTHCKNCGLELEWRVRKKTGERVQKWCPPCAKESMRRSKQRRKAEK